MPAWSSVVLSASNFRSFRVFFCFFFSPTCAPAGWSPQSLKESHNIWIATYHTLARKKLNLHSLRWMLCWSGHFRAITLLFCSACLLRRGRKQSLSLQMCMSNASEWVLSNYPVSVLSKDMWLHKNVFRGKGCLFRGQDFVARRKTRAIFENQEDQFVSTSLIFSHFTAQKAAGLGTHRVEHHLPRNQLTVFILLIHY